MTPLLLHDFHRSLNASFTEIHGAEVVAHYGDWLAEYQALHTTAGVLELSFRSRLCLLGADRIEFLHGQVTNDVEGLKVGEGCYAALVNAKGKMQSDLNIYRLQDELLLDFEPGLATAVQERLDKYVVASDVQMVDVAPHYALWSLQGPRAAEVVQQFGMGIQAPLKPMSFVALNDPDFGQCYCMNHSRAGSTGFDLFVPNGSAEAVAQKLASGAKEFGGRPCGWDALEIARIEAGIPRFGVDMDETNLAPEAGLEERAISYTKGCYIGQEVIARIRTYGQVAKGLRGLRLPDDLPTLPKKGDKLFKNGKDVGYLTSITHSPALRANLALGYVRREVNQFGTELGLGTADSPQVVRIVALPFQSSSPEQG